MVPSSYALLEDPAADGRVDPGCDLGCGRAVTAASGGDLLEAADGRVGRLARVAVGPRGRSATARSAASVAAS